MKARTTRDLALLGALSIGLLLTGCPRPETPSAEPKQPSAQAPGGAAHTSAPVSPAAQPQPQGKADPAANAKAKDVLEKMVAAYSSATSYSDAGTVSLKAMAGDRRVEDNQSFKVSLVRPNKVRMEVYQAVLACDGKELKGLLKDLPNQVLVKPAPPEVSMEVVHADRLLTEVMSRGFARAAPQIMLLLHDKPLDILLFEADSSGLEPPAEIGGRPHHRVAVHRKDGKTVYWIDQQTNVLRRVEYATEELQRQLSSADRRIESMSMVAEFAGAQLNGPVDPAEFRLEAPKGAEVVSFLRPPHPAQLLGKKVPDFKFVNMDGQPVLPESYAGKVVLVDFWATWCGPCRQSFPALQAVYEKFKDNKRVLFQAVSVDEAETANAKIAATLKDLKVTMPALRDLEGHAGRVFMTDGIPARFLIGMDGVVQDYEVGVNPDAEAQLPGKIESLLAGKNIYQEPLARYLDEVKKMEQSLDGPDAAAMPPAADSVQREIPKAEVAAKSQPKHLKLKSAWATKEVRQPGNLLVVDSAGGQRLFVLDGWKSVAELALDGKFIRSYRLDVPDDEAVGFLRTAVVDGQRRYAASASAQQQVHLFDADWKTTAHFPADVSEKHAGIADVQFVDFAGDGKPLLCVSYWGQVGVQGVGIDGKRLWSNRSIENVLRIAETSPDAGGRRQLVCVNSRGTLVTLDAKGEKTLEAPIPDRMIHWIVSADLDGDKRLEFCGLSAAELGVNVVVGIDPAGKELWKYPLPKGVHEQPVELIVAGKLFADAAGQWLLPGADGSVHIIAAGGTPLDQFNHGAAICGLATATAGGRTLLVIASPEGVEAFEVGR